MHQLKAAKRREGSIAAVRTRIGRIRYAPLRDQVDVNAERRFGPVSTFRTANGGGRADPAGHVVEAKRIGA